jgi:hypothetical protein
VLHQRVFLPVVAAFLTASAAPVDVGHHRQLFVDDYLVASQARLRRVIHPVTKYAGNPILLPVKPWEGQYTHLYGTVIRDEQEGIWKAWYSTLHQFRYIRHQYPESTYICYATSRDGIHWDKPALGAVAYRGSTENNIVMQADEAPAQHISGVLDTVSVIKDSQDRDGARRYKMMVWHGNERLVNGKWQKNLEPPLPMGYYVAFSPDGIHWKTQPDPVFIYDPVRDTMNTMWDPRTRRYLAFVKEHVDHKRARFVSESEDFLHWSKPVPILAADAHDDPSTELYNNTGFLYEGMYLGLLTVFHPLPLTNIYLDVQLISSRDGRTWQRVGDRSPTIPAGRMNIDWDFGFQSPASGAPVRVGDELWIYYSGRSYRHPVDGQEREPNHGAIGLGKLRLDGFVSMDAGAEEGELVTRPLRFDDPALFVNADAARGQIRVEVLDEAGQPVAGFRKEDNVAIERDAIRAPARWRSAADLSSLRGRTVRLKFYIRQASLYSFAFGAI